MPIQFRLHLHVWLFHTWLPFHVLTSLRFLHPRFDQSFHSQLLALRLVTGRPGIPSFPAGCFFLYVYNQELQAFFSGARLQPCAFLSPPPCLCQVRTSSAARMPASATPYTPLPPPHPSAGYLVSHTFLCVRCSFCAHPGRQAFFGLHPRTRVLLSPLLVSGAGILLSHAPLLSPTLCFAAVFWLFLSHTFLPGVSHVDQAIEFSQGQAVAMCVSFAPTCLYQVSINVLGLAHSCFDQPTASQPSPGLCALSFFVRSCPVHTQAIKVS